MSDDFKWTDKESVVFGTVLAVAVYSNPAGDVVIRQEGGSLDENDSFVVIPRDRLEALILALQELERQG